MEENKKNQIIDLTDEDIESLEERIETKLPIFSMFSTVLKCLVPIYGDKYIWRMSKFNSSIAACQTDPPAKNLHLAMGIAAIASKYISYSGFAYLAIKNFF